MSIFNIFRKTKQEEPPKLPVKEELPKFESNISLVEYPKYDMYFEFLDMVKGKRINEMFYGNTSLIPKNKRNELIAFFDKCLSDEWVYVTKGNESIAGSFTKNDFVKLLKENNLPISGNKIDLVERIETNVGLKSFYDTGNVSDWIRLTDLGKSKLKEYKSNFDKEYNEFEQNIFSLFLSDKILDACKSVISYKESYPFERTGFTLSNSYDSLIGRCKISKNSNVLSKLGIPEKYHNSILSLFCMNYSLGIDYRKEIESFYNGFEQLLINSDLIINKDFAYYDLQELIEGREVRKYVDNRL